MPTRRRRWTPQSVQAWIGALRDLAVLAVGVVVIVREQLGEGRANLLVLGAALVGIGLPGFSAVRRGGDDDERR